MDLKAESLRLDGYLLAASDLKGDGTHMRCLFISHNSPQNSLSEIECSFQFPTGSCVLIPATPSKSDDKNFFTSLKSWMQHTFDPANRASKLIENRLFDGLIAEISNIFDQDPHFFDLVCPHKSSIWLGAISSIYVFGTPYGTCAIHCSWDD